MSATPLIEFRRISKRFGGVQALSDVSLAIESGTIHGLVGENGAGKSTLIKITGGVYRKDSGSVLWNGHEVDILSPSQAERIGISIVHQEIPLCDNLTIAQNVFLGRLRTGFLGQPNWREMEEKTAELFRQIGQDHIDPGRPVAGLSVALRQLTAIVQALNKEAKLLIMDEPTAALTPDEVKTLFDVLRRLRREGKTILFVSHILSEVMEITDRISVLRNGQHVATRKTTETTTDEVVHMMVGNIDLRPQEKTRQPQEQTVLSVQHLSQPKLRLRDISFDLKKGEILGVAGIQGAGRTELATCLFGVTPPAAGRVFLDGQQIDCSSPRDCIKSGIGYLTEDRRNLGVFWEMNVWENLSAVVIDKLITVGGLLNQEAIREMADHSVRELNIRTAGLHQGIRFLSGGNQQKVLLSRWLNAQPKVLILDEPTRGVDVGAKSEIRRIIQQLAEEELSLIVISSDLEELVALCDRILVMANGTIKGEFPTADVSTEKIMSLATSK